MTTRIEYSSEQIFDLIRGSWLLKGSNHPLEFLSLDSRKISDPSATIFWAVSSESGDGSAYIMELYARGVRNFVTQNTIDVKGLDGSNIILVNNSVDALQELAAGHRKRFRNIHVIGITGSNGKTVVKEWLGALLSESVSVVKNPRSYNSQIGVPLSILQIRDHHRVGIFEAGISKPGEMKKLERMIRPHTGILTNIGSAHDEGFADIHQKIREKVLLFKGCSTLVCPGKHADIDAAVKSLNVSRKLTTLKWCTNGCSLKIEKVEKSTDHADLMIDYEKNKYPITIPFIDDASAENAISCFGGLQASGFFQRDMLQRFRDLEPVTMRLEMKPGINQSVIINDSYSNDLQSLRVAIDFLKQQNNKRTTVILSDVLQSGLDNTQLYTQVSQILKNNKVSRLIGIGEEISEARTLFKDVPDSYFFADTVELVKSLDNFQFADEAVLIKGARKFSFERISQLLEAQIHQTVFSINLSNLAHNIRVYKSLLNPGTKLMAMVKAFAYGSGSREIASLLQFVKADYLAVAFTDEGVALRNAGISLPVMVLNVEQDGFESLVRHQLEPEIFSFRLLQSFTEFLTRKNINHYPVHLKIDTGMHRLGFSTDDLKRLATELKSNKRLKIQSVFTHLSSSDNPEHDDVTKLQFATFKKAVRQLKTVVKDHFDCHIANTSAVSRFPEFQMDMVRVGIGMYGIDDNPFIKDQLRVVNKLTTTISQIKKVKAGEVVGYGKNVLKTSKTIATIGIGYADGYPRLLGNGKAKMLVHGKPAGTVGNICMDMTMLDITGIKDVQEGDEVIVFGDLLPVQKVARWAKTIPYEIFTGISPRVRRIYFEE